MPIDFVDIPQEFVLSIGPKDFRYKVIRYGEKSYLCQALDSKKYPYVVMEKRVELSEQGCYMAMLYDNQKYQPHESLEEAEKHFKAYEAHLCPLMFALGISVDRFLKRSEQV